MLRFNHQGDNSRGNNNYNAFTYRNMTWSAHFHKNMELICVLRGEVPISVNESEFLLHTGEWALMLSNQIHSFTVGRDAMAWVAVFSEDFVPEFAAYVKDKQGKTSSFYPDEECRALIMENMLMGEPSFLMKRACLYAACDQFMKKVLLEPRKNKNDQLICRVLDYIEEHFQEDISLQTVAQEFGYEYHYLSRLLNRGYSIRFKQVVNGYRVDLAKRLLKKREQNMTEISQLCGFRSIRSFNDVFLEFTGYSPSDYQKQIDLNVKKM